MLAQRVELERTRLKKRENNQKRANNNQKRKEFNNQKRANKNQKRKQIQNVSERKERDAKQQTKKQQQQQQKKRQKFTLERSLRKIVVCESLALFHIRSRSAAASELENRA